MQKGQTSVEFLIIVSVVLIILSLVAVQFFQITDSVDKDVETSRLYWENVDLAVIDHFLNETHLNMTIKNNLYNIIRIEDINITNYGNLSTFFVLYPKQTRQLIIPMSYNTTESGTTYRLNLRFEYRNFENTQMYNFTGQLPLMGTFGGVVVN